MGGMRRSHLDHLLHDIKVGVDVLLNGPDVLLYTVCASSAPLRVGMSYGSSSRNITVNEPPRLQKETAHDFNCQE